MSTPGAPIALCLCLFALAGCSNPDAQPPAASEPGSPQNTGEPLAPAPPTPASQTPAAVKATAQAALAAFAERYVNWSYRTLQGDQQALARIAVGAARLAEQQAAAASTADSTISQGHLWNRGSVVSIAADRSQPGRWVVVTREQTGGSSQYQGLPAAYHVTLAELAAVPAGWAVSQWLPQS